VHDVHGSLPTWQTRPTYYYAYRQLPFRARAVVLAIRTSQPPASLIALVRAALRATDPEVPVEFRTMEERVAGSVADRRFTMIVLGAFATAALLLAAVGVYGVVSYGVARRTREIGIRIALGALPSQVKFMVHRRAMLMVGTGVIAGIAGALALTRVLRTLLYDVAPADPMTFGGVIGLIATAGWLASWIPARRGARVDPMTAIRTE
jgi:putative ABC transport system permease protein